jgi:hypothetical protein
MHPSIEKIMQFGLDQNQALQIISLFKTEVILKRNDFWLKGFNIKVLINIEPFSGFLFHRLHIPRVSLGVIQI